MITLAESSQVFIKDFAYSIMHMADDNFLDSFRHSFLIRDPEKVLTSMHSRWPDATLGEIGFEDLHTLYNRIADREGELPVVIDSDELLNNVASGIQVYCNAVGIPYIPQAMKWKSSEDTVKNPTWNSDEHGFHDNLKSSTGLQKQNREYPPLKSSADMMRLYKASMPHFEKLFEHRLRF